MFNQWIHRNQNHDLEIECVLKALNLASKAVIGTGWLSDLDATCAQDKCILDTSAVILKLPLRVGNLCTLWKCKSILLFGFTSQQQISACNKLWHKFQQQIRLLSGNKTAFTQLFSTVHTIFIYESTASTVFPDMLWILLSWKRAQMKLTLSELNTGLPLQMYWLYT